MIELNRVIKCYGQKNVVNDISFSIPEGELFGFLGPNGAGKSTTIRMITGLLKPTSGSIIVNGHDVIANKKSICEDIGVVFELQNLYLRSSIEENLKLFAALYRVNDKQVNQVMEELQLTERRKMAVKKLSKGWKQRVLIARALLHQPKILFLDEPTSGLDPNTAILIRNHIKRVNEKGTTVVLTTHDMYEADEMSNRVGIMNEGRLVAIDTPERLKQQHGKNEIFVEYKDNGNINKKNLPFGTNETNQFIAQLIKEGRVVNIHTMESSFSTVFAELTGRKLN
ncbi:ABC transporter ATP-binding protein [Tissierella carlieri]|uniref:ABC transporter ATP-binding protein n=1 Tax=Tissierella carlieri TaxID=689904 RepID=A0ABT1S667_9FIRM|nr:ABC transporter ATP-binding protein [Tissierella carlieri]MCQ4921972.1 ABC transporter ATP-binding protein [Tissierella carlieri]